MGDEEAKVARRGICFFCPCRRRVADAVCMKNMLSSMVVFGHSFTHPIHGSLGFHFVSQFSF